MLGKNNPRSCCRLVWLTAVLLLAGTTVSAVCRADEPAPPSLDSRAEEAIRGLTSEDAYVRQRSFLQLEALRNPASVDSIRPFVDNKDEDMRAWSLRALVAIQGAAVIPLLRERAQSDKEPSVRRAALLGLEPLAAADPTLVQFFVDRLSERSPEVRMTAVDIVSRIQDPVARSAVRERAKHEGNRDVRKVLAAALQRIGPAE